MPTIIERLHQLGVGRRTLGVELEGWAETYGEDLVRLVECEATRGSITQRGRGSWQVAFRTGGGDRVRETVRGTRTDAERRLTELLREYDMTGLVPDREATVSMVAEQWLEHVAHRIKPITLKRYRELLTVHVVPVIGSIHMTELRPAGVQAVVTKVLEHRSPRTAVNTYRVLSEMLGEGVRWGVMATNPALAIRPPRAPRADLHIPDATTCTAILERARGRSVEGALTLALGTGMRLGEILAVRWRDVDLERKALHVTATLSYLGGEFTFPQPKTSRARRSVDLPVFVVGFLRRHRRTRTRGRWRVGGCGRTTTSCWITALDCRWSRGRCRRTSAGSSQSLGCRGRGSTTCDTLTQRNCSAPVCTRRQLASGWGTAASRSRWTHIRP